MENRINIFFSYSNRDEKLADQLRYYLETLEMQGLVTVWNDREIRPGVVWASEIEKKLKEAQIIVLLISPDYLESDFYREMGKVIVERGKAGQAQVIPVLLRPVPLEKTPLKDFISFSLPAKDRPVTKWSNRDMAFLNITEGIRDAISNLKVETSPSVEEVQTGYQKLWRQSWERDLPPPSQNPYANEFNALEDKLRRVNEDIQSYKNILLVSDDPNRKDYAKRSIEGLVDKIHELLTEYNELRKKLNLPPVSIDDMRELLNAL